MRKLTCLPLPAAKKQNNQLVSQNRCSQKKNTNRFYGITEIVVRRGFRFPATTEGRRTADPTPDQPPDRFSWMRWNGMGWDGTSTATATTRTRTTTGNRSRIRQINARGEMASTSTLTLICSDFCTCAKIIKKNKSGGKNSQQIRLYTVGSVGGGPKLF